MKTEAYQVIKTTFAIADFEIAKEYEKHSRIKGTFRSKKEDDHFIEIEEWAWVEINLQNLN